MGTLADIKGRIITETAKDDIELDIPGTLLEHIRKAVRFYQNRNWWFLKYSTTTPTVAAQNYITRPTSINRITRVSIPSLGYELEKSDVECLDAYDEPTAQTGQPCEYAEYGAQLRLWPTPSAIYTVKITGTRLFTELTDDADSNVWTNEAADLIVAQAKMSLYRDLWGDDAGFQMALGDVKDALNALEEANIDRLDAPMKAGW